MSTPTIVEVAEAYRAALARREMAAVSKLIREYGDIWKSLKVELDRLLRAHAERIARGEVPSPAWLYQEERARALMDQVEREVTKWSADVERTTRDLQRQGVQAGQEYTAKVMAEYGIRTSFIRMSPDTVANMIGFLGDGSPLARLFDGIGKGVRASFGKVLTTGLAAGLGPREVARMAKRATGMGMDRALRIARTEMLRASREAVHQDMINNPDVVAGWIWSCALSDRTCPACLAMNGTWHPITERLEAHPNCRCAQVPSVKPLRGRPGAIQPRPIQIPDAEAWLNSQTAVEQDRILGKAAAELWRQGRIGLDEFPERRDDPDWGAMWTTKPLYRIIADHG